MNLLDDKKELEELYVNRSFSAQKIADIISVDKSTVCRALKRHGIQARKRTSKYPKLNDKKWLIEQYEGGRSITNIAKELGCLEGVVASSLYAIGVKTRSPKEAWATRFPCGRNGEVHPMWRGGTSRIGRRIRGLKLFKEWRIKILIRDKKKCVLCESKKRLEVDHIIQLAEIINKYSITNIEQAKNVSELWSIDNGRVLCHKCHLSQETHSRKIAKKKKLC